MADIQKAEIDEDGLANLDQSDSMAESKVNSSDNQAESNTVEKDNTNDILVETSGLDMDNNSTPAHLADNTASLTSDDMLNTSEPHITDSSQSDSQVNDRSSRPVPSSDNLQSLLDDSVTVDAESSMVEQTAERSSLSGAAAASPLTPDRSEASGTSGVTATSPLMEDVKQKAAQLKSQDGHEEEPGKDIYHLKWIKFKGRKVPIVTQNQNGPCPLIAIINVLLLQGKITLDSTAEVVTSSQLMGYLGDIVLQTIPGDLEQGQQANWEQNVNDAIAVFHKLQTGLDVNVRFTGVNAFEYTSECIVFDLLSISLYHGWLVDTSAPDTMNAVGSLTYNQLVEKIIENTGSTDGEKSSQAILGQIFLNDSASQLTYHGLSELASTLNDDQMAVFFRNNHFSTIYKFRNELFLLVTDQGYLRESRVVWETLSNVEGDGELVDSDFRAARSATPVEQNPNIQANTQEQVDHDLMLAMSINAQQEAVESPEAASSVETDEQFAKRLQEEENRAAAAAMEAQQQEQQRQQYPPAQGQPGQQGHPPPADNNRQQAEGESGEKQAEGRTRKRSGSCILL